MFIKTKKNFLKDLLFRIKNKKGLTLIEMIVTIGIFVLTFTMAAGLIVEIIKMQNRARVMRMIQEEARYALEEITREGRLAQGDPPFGDGGDRIIFKIKENESKIVSWNSTSKQLSIQRTGSSVSLPLTSDKVEILRDGTTNIFQLSSTGQPYLVIRFKIQPNPFKFPSYTRNISALFQTSISSRKYDF